MDQNESIESAKLGVYKNMEWENLGSQYLVENEFLKVRQDKVKLPSGVIIDDFFVIEKKNVSVFMRMLT